MKRRDECHYAKLKLLYVLLSQKLLRILFMAKYIHRWTGLPTKIYLEFLDLHIFSQQTVQLITKYWL